MTDIYCDIIDNFGDIAFAVKVINTYTFKKKETNFRFFSNNYDLFVVFSKSFISEVNITYYNFSEIKTLPPSQLILNLFERRIDYDFLESFKYSIKIINFSYFSLESYSWEFTPGIVQGHGRIIKSKNLIVEDLSVSLLENTGWVFSEKIFIKEIIQKEFYEKKYTIPWNKKWISIFCYPETQQQLESQWFFEKFWNEYVFLSFWAQVLKLKNNVHLPFLPMQEYYFLTQYCQWNIVRWENSLITALESWKPFYWDIYKERNSAHQEKIYDFCEYLKMKWYDDDYITAQKSWNLEYNYSPIHKIFTQKKEN